MYYVYIKKFLLESNYLEFNLHNSVLCLISSSLSKLFLMRRKENTRVLESRLERCVCRILITSVCTVTLLRQTFNIQPWCSVCFSRRKRVFNSHNLSPSLYHGNKYYVGVLCCRYERHTPTPADLLRDGGGQSLCKFAHGAK